jgi:hypothetical protein
MIVLFRRQASSNFSTPAFPASRTTWMLPQTVRAPRSAASRTQPRTC